MIQQENKIPNRKEQVSNNKVNTLNFQLTYRYTFTYKSY